MEELIQIIEYNYLYWMLGSYVGLWLILLLISTWTDFTLRGNPLSAILLSWLIALGLHLIATIVTIGVWGNQLYQSGETILFILFNYLFIVISICIDSIIIIMLVTHLNRVKRVPRAL
jgi:fatty acid desaturase